VKLATSRNFKFSYDRFAEKRAAIHQWSCHGGIAFQRRFEGGFTMQSYLEKSFQRDIERIKKNIVQMACYAETGLKNSLKACSELNRELAYVVILRDLYIDEKEKEIDRLCLEFFIRQQPVAFPMRFAYSTIKVNLEIERVGDYAESIARRVLKLKEKPPAAMMASLAEMGERAISMFHDSIKSFVDQNPELAKKTMEIEDVVDALRFKLQNDFLRQMEDNKLLYEMVEPLLTVVKRLERVADQARNICIEVLYMCTGEQVKHPGAEAFRVLFLDDRNKCRSQVAEALALSLNQPRFIFSSAGIEPEPIDRATVDFMRKKGFDLSHAVPKALHQIPNLDYYHVIVALSPNVHKMFPQRPRKSIFLDWPVDDPSVMEGSAEVKEAAFERLFRYVQGQVKDLVKAIIGSEEDGQCKE
jgi:phosphate transport system protein